MIAWSIVNWLKEKALLIAVIAIGVLLSILMFTSSSLRKERIRNERYRNNEKALILEMDSLKNESLVYEITAEQLSYFNDSISRKLDSVVTELNVQKRRLSQVQYIETVSEIHDSIVLKDTVFVEGVELDTVLTDGRWYSIELSLSHPSTLRVSPEFVEELYVVLSEKKETINTPSKVFFVRWFQKKHTIIEAEVETGNPHSSVKNSRFVKIVK